jgi:large subunit ribosomal protein L21
MILHVKAIVDVGGRQEKVTIGEKVLLSLPDDYSKEVCSLVAKAIFEDSGVLTGQDASSYEVTAKILRQVKGPKVIGFYYRPKTNYRRRFGHRQHYFEAEIISIEKKES